jgi:hypothetical protein
MSYGLHHALGIGVGVVLSLGWFAWACDQAASTGLDEDARLAIELRCRDQEGRAQRECRALLKKLYLARSLDPDTTLRSYCDSFKNARWGGTRPAPPEVCIERYGGWPES